MSSRQVQNLDFANLVLHQGFDPNLCAVNCAKGKNGFLVSNGTCHWIVVALISPDLCTRILQVLGVFCMLNHLAVDRYELNIRQPICRHGSMVAGVSLLCGSCCASAMSFLSTLSAQVVKAFRHEVANRAFLEICAKDQHILLCEVRMDTVSHSAGHPGHLWCRCSVQNQHQEVVQCFQVRENSAGQSAACSMPMFWPLLRQYQCDQSIGSSRQKSDCGCPFCSSRSSSQYCPYHLAQRLEIEEKVCTLHSKAADSKTHPPML